MTVRTLEFHLYSMRRGPELLEAPHEIGGKMAIPDYPTTLTNADWQKKKGVFAKMFGETGIGAALIKAKSVHDGINWQKMDCLNAYPNLQALELAEKTAIEEFHAKVPHLIAELGKVRTLAQAVAKKIPPTAVKAVTAIGVACTSYIGELNKLEEMGHFDNAREKAENTARLMVQAVNQAAQKITTGIEECKKTHTVTAYGNHLLQAVRAYAAVIARCAPLKAFHEQWHALSSLTLDKLSDQTVAGHVGKVETLFHNTQHALQNN